MQSRQRWRNSVKCNQNLVRTWGLRSACALVAAAAGFGITYEGALLIWQLHLPLLVEVASAAIPAVITLAVTKTLATFTVSCMHCAPPKKSDTMRSLDKSGSMTSSLRDPKAGKFALATAVSPNPDSAFVTVKLVQNAKVTIETTAPGDDGLATVTVTTSGVTNSQLDVFINRLRKTTGVKWGNHKRLIDGRKQIVGKAQADKQQVAFAQLVQIADKYAG